MINSIFLNSRYGDKSEMLNTLAKRWDPQENLDRIPSGMLTEALSVQISDIDTSLRGGNDLSIVQAFSGMLHVVAGTNNRLQELLFPEISGDISRTKGAFYLTRMAAKEQYVGLTPGEVAGMVMAGLLDIVYCPPAAELSETSGMGADRGWKGKRVKTINASTLTALVLASMDYPSIKHGSYGNTTKIGSTDVPEQFGANICESNPDRIEQILRECGFWFNDAHSVKTLHYLSHRLMVETVNHIVGPMTPPVSQRTKLYKLMGVNHYVHPEIIAKAYALLHGMGVLNLGGAVILAGISGKAPKHIGPENRSWYLKNCYLDEVSPEQTLVSLSYGSEFLGTHLVNTSKTFGVSFSDKDIQVTNEIDPLMRANQLALRGKSPFAEYLSLNAAFAIAAHYLESGDRFLKSLPVFAEAALEFIKQGAAFDTLRNYVKSSGGKFVSWE
ncbi:hypothetical protein A3K34_01510 [candidate division WWE3 bacterium RIFOXYC1_FULL_40_10]|uniref:Glycosyl transferase family 3 domain-containing protein n=1 Tax=candidate division WWE3 bacterium RIFOXYA2_FULL_46_9 TaxID=1802636 RepID=A0A1F4W2E7_UNCKA|nr:MAG: hypothetical protein A3K58_01510 [candidate division WWE3 bacterium RIFOXYB1_FULL_40_22]OGC61544.1 MAG: hypothetical protein A3K37_01510 [candidate division WWE3 bacterium RIFOXYA1_FULL_40_11]OGC63592.1 MAG: hypothetical protein A2264_04450 [candidate division WWE3 bacterium RIFOXYA2_FULL_46_9]OGC64777.1 MAG: hypothetical protein A2326_01945 [candidate division WWE3 bacterium RIFOXYB2_FULL_41_6]OGC65927.1 MAG: hypothetical protein A3K34_01510 [candidate division WWE3 bacterium RIFOXYC1_